MATTRLIPMHIGKGKTISASISDRTDYAINPNKTNDGEFISSYECNPRTVDAEFLLAKRQYSHISGRNQNKRDVLAYQIRQSFRPGEVTPEQANKIGYELALAFTKGKHQFIVATHVDKAHIHSHIIFNSTTIDGTRKFNNFSFSGYALRCLSDRICLEHGLSIIENPKQSKGHYGKWLGDKKLLSWQEKLKLSIDEALESKPKDFSEFLNIMLESGYEVKRSKYLSFCAKEQKRFTRLKSLGEDYSEDAILACIQGKKRSISISKANEAKVNLLVDIENSIKAKNSVGYERWAKVFNLKQAAQTLIFLQESGISDYDDLVEKTVQTSKDFMDRSNSIKVYDSRMKEINELQKHISNYSRTKDVYAKYRESGYSEKFYSQHEGDILIHQAAKKFFDVAGLEKLPTIKKLQTEYATLSAEQKKLYSEYNVAREKMKSLATVKANADLILSVDTSKVSKKIER